MQGGGGIATDSISISRFFNQILEFGEVWGNAIGGIIISGTKENMIENLSLENIDASLPGGITEYEQKEVSYMKEKYPEFHRMDIVPAKGIYIRDVKGCSLNNINLTFKEDDVRETIVCENEYCVFGFNSTFIFQDG